MRAHFILGARSGMISQRGGHTEVKCKMSDRSWSENEPCQERYLLSSPRSLLFTFEPRPSSPSLIYRGSALTPTLSQASVIDEHQHASITPYPGMEISEVV